MQLIYRGQTFPYIPPAPQPYRQPQALNWRWHVPGQTYGEVASVVRTHHQAQALNWRWQLSAEG